MKISLVSHGHAGAVHPIDQLLPRLDRQIAGGAPAWLRPLAEILLRQIPEALRGGVGPDQLFDSLQAVADFLEKRSRTIKVELAPLENPGHYYLLCNSPDANYIFTSIQEYLHREAYNFRVICHPMLTIRRQRGRLVALADTGEEGACESFVWIELRHFADSSHKPLLDAVRDIVGAAIKIAAARPRMLERMRRLGAQPELASYRDLFEWLCDDRFVPLAACAFRERRGEAVAAVAESALGIEHLSGDPLGKGRRSLDLTAEIFAARTTEPSAVVLERSELCSPIRHFERLTYLGIREQLAADEVVEHGFWGFYTQLGLEEPAQNIPVLKARIDSVLQQLHIPTASHNYRKIREILNSFPKVELFLLSAAELHQMVQSFVQMHRQSGVKVVVAPNMSGAGLTLLLIMPRSFYSVATIARIENYLRRYFKAEAVDSRNIHLSADYLSIHVNLRVLRQSLQVDLIQLEHALTRLALPWNRRFRRLLELDSDRDSHELYQRYHNAFDADYKTRLHPRFAVRDVRIIEQLLADGKPRFDLWGPFEGEERYYRLQYYKTRRSYLNDLMPFLENLGLTVIEEVDYLVRIDGREIYIKSFAIRGGHAKALPIDELKPRLIGMLSALDDGRAENDYLNNLLILTGLDWQEIDVFRAYRNYYFQLGTTFTKKRVAYALINNPQVALLLYRYFEGRFQPRADWRDALEREEKVLFPLRLNLVEALDRVEESNEDRILRTLFNLIDATVRTNFFKRRAMDDYFVSFKISSLGVMEMPQPRPMFEIYVHSATMEGIHLRGGKVARGGIRWSDRPDDFRTEVLGLMKAQMTKNAVIVPVGSKGGFIVKTAYSGRDEGLALAKDAYQYLMRGLLDLTDNQTPKGLERPAGIVAYDEHDPYLVVAADKGTAHLSDTANAESLAYDFWLGDAFASGGSHGYDHKKLGITARGAWESVKRHFREMGRDIQREPFTVVGIGDMSGDVFGNGMLLSKQARLLAAFDHRHIFLDPDPDPEASYKERRRLFRLARSSWADYNPQLISQGGGIYSRELKEIPLSPEVRKWLGVRHGSIDVPGLIQLLLAAEVDLLWNGGIGTYVKSSQEQHAEVGDRSNDAVRVDASQLRCQVIGEGGNLGLTQRARIEFAALGGRLNTDAVDNSGGVDSSDHEVNLKILLQVLRHGRKVRSLEEGYALLAEMEEQVCQDVLADNYHQTLAISLDEIRCERNAEPFLELMDRLGSSGLLDRRDEFLPSRKEVATRHPARLLRPELSVLLAYGKMALFRALLEEGIPGGPVTDRLLQSYFPRQIIERYAGMIGKHPLAREIAATVLTNHIVDCAGSGFCPQLARQTGVSLARVAYTYLLLDHLLDAEVLRQTVYALDNRMPAQQQYWLLLELEQVLAGFCHFALGHDLALPHDSNGLRQLRDWFDEYRRLLPEALPAAVREECEARRGELVDAGLPKAVAADFALMSQLHVFLPLVRLAQETGLGLGLLLPQIFAVRARLEIERLIACVERVVVHDSWDRRAREALLASLANLVFNIVRRVALEETGDVEGFFRRQRQKHRGYRELADRLFNEKANNFHPFSVLLRSLEGFLGG